MHKLLTIILALCSMALNAQNTFETGQWCASNKTALGNMSPTALDGRSDSIDLGHAWINLDLSAVSSHVISGNCRWTFTPKVVGVDKLRFDLLGFTVDSVVLNNENTAFERIGATISIPLASPLAVGTINSVTMYYQGTPVQDASGWGGFYFSGNYAFNLGVGFAADPHVFGRAWFPCFDNFEERSTYTFDILTTPEQPAYCNGYILNDENTLDGKRRRIWLLNQAIPSYLACVAIGPYTSFKRSYPGQNGSIPVEIAATASDTNKVRNTFQHLPQAISGFEYWYGPYKWPKIGYSLVPFDYGAMEHATNISIGRSYIDGTLNFETLWAHELSHHWWGDLATCSSAEDMWLNEGWASYSEHLFTEWVYGKTAYKNAVRANFLTVLQTAHVEEGQYWAVSGVPHNLTYGKHVYNKGAVVAHNLRGYLGDSLFRQGIRYALENTNFNDWSSADFRDKLETGTGQNLHDFFNDWVFAGGYPDYVLDSVKWEPTPGAGGMLANVYVRQKLRGAPHFHQNVPLEFTFVDQFGHRQNHKRVVSGETSMVQILVPGSTQAWPEVWINPNLTLLQARTENEKMIKAPGNSNFIDSKFNLTVNSLAVDSVLFRVEHHYANPDDGDANPNGFALTSRFWQVYSVGSTAYDAQATIIYDGRAHYDQLDSLLFANTGMSEDSIRLLYRQGAGHPWVEWPAYNKITLSNTNDGFGQLRILHLLPGQYTIGKGASMVAAQEPSNAYNSMRISPNPVRQIIKVENNIPFTNIVVLNLEGVVVMQRNCENAKSIEMPVQDLPEGHYWLVLRGKSGYAVQPFVKI